MRLALIGPRAAGKTSVAPALAKSLDCPCFDLDAAVEEVVGEPLRSFIERAGWEAFRIVEFETFAQLLRAQDFVLACGAGIVETEAARRLLREATDRRLWLDLTPSGQLVRLGDQDHRPPLHPDLSQVDELERLDALRRPLYAALASRRIDASVALPKVITACLKS